MEGNLLDRAMK